MVQESWSAIVPLALLCVGKASCLSSRANMALLCMFLAHYVYRSCIYPLRMRGGKPMPAGVCALATTIVDIIPY